MNKYKVFIEQAQLELEQCGSAENSVDFGTLSIFSTKSNLKEHVSLSDITCVSICTQKLVPQLYIFTSKRSKLLRPIQIKFSSEADLWDWHSDLVTGNRYNCLLFIVYCGFSL